MEISGTNLGEAAVGRVDKPGGLCQAFGLPTRAPTDEAPVRPQSAGVVKASRDLCEWDVRTPDWSGIRRDFGLFCGFLGKRRRRYGRRLSAGIGCRCLGRGLLSWLLGLRGCWSATVVPLDGDSRQVNNVLQIPNRTVNGWEATNPKGLEEWYRQQNRRTNGKVCTGRQDVEALAQSGAAQERPAAFGWVGSDDRSSLAVFPFIRFRC